MDLKISKHDIEANQLSLFANDLAGPAQLLELARELPDQALEPT